MPAVAFAVFAATLRPPDAPLCVAVAVFGALAAREAKAPPAVVLAAGIVAIFAVMPVMIWNLWYFDSIVSPGQLTANARATEKIFNFSPGHLALGSAGLLVSPARGVLWFAPVWLVGAWPRTRLALPLTVGVAAQLVVAAVFYKWWGGMTFGPRLLALSLWVAIFAAASWPPRRRAVLGAALGVTLAVGLLGALRYDPRRWEIPNNPDEHPEALWQLTDSPLPAMLGQKLMDVRLQDAPPGPFVLCAAPGTALEDLPSGHP